MKKTISPMQRHFLQKEAQSWTDDGIISATQQEAILQRYVIAEAKKTNITQIFIAIGAILLGLGVLSFVASNWALLTDWTKFSLQLLLFLSLVLGGHILDARRPRWAEALFITGALAYGALIFQIGQIFHLAGSSSGLFIAWSIGILPLAYYRKSAILRGFTHVLFYLYYYVEMTATDELFWASAPPLQDGLFLFAQLLAFTLLTTGMPFIRTAPDFVRHGLSMAYPKGQTVLRFGNVLFIYWSLFFIGSNDAFWVAGIGVIGAGLIVWRNVSRLHVAAFTVFAVAVGALFIVEYSDKPLISTVCYFLFVGLLFQFAEQIQPHFKYWKKPGMLLTFVSLLLLSLQVIWWEIDGTPYMLFIVLSFGYALWLVKVWHPRAVWLAALVIFRLYVDVAFLFANKALAFVIGGLLVLALAYGISRYTKKGGQSNEQQS